MPWDRGVCIAQQAIKAEFRQRNPIYVHLAIARCIKTKMPLEWVTPFSTPQNNVLKFFLTSIIMYPLVEMLVDGLVSRIATREILRGGTVCPHSTRIGSFGPNTVYWGSRHNRAFILFGALLYNALALAGEFGFDSTQIDKWVNGSYVSRTNITQFAELKQIKHLEIPAHTPFVSADYFSCFDENLQTSLRQTEYPPELDNATPIQRLQWCRRARKQSYTLRYQKFSRKNFARHCHKYLKERPSDFQLRFNGSAALRHVLQKRRFRESLLRIRCEANSLQKTPISGFAVGGFLESTNRDMLKFDLFGMRAKFALYMNNVPTTHKPLTISVTGRFSQEERTKHSRYFSSGMLSCVELRNDRRILCLETARSAGSAITVNMTDWIITSGRGRTANSSSGPVRYEILRSGMIMSLNLTRTGPDSIVAESYRKMVALYEIMQLQGMQIIWSNGLGKFRKRTKFSQVTAINIAKVIIYRMTVNKIELASQKEDEPALERVGSRELAMMNSWAWLFYGAPLITVAVLLVLNLILHIKLRKEAGEADVPLAHRITVQYRILSTTLSKILEVAGPPRAFQRNDRRIDESNNGVHVIGLLSRGEGVGFIWRRSDGSRINCGCGIDQRVSE